MKHERYGPTDCLSVLTYGHGAIPRRAETLRRGKIEPWIYIATYAAWVRRPRTIGKTQMQFFDLPDDGQGGAFYLGAII